LAKETPKLEPAHLGGFVASCLGIQKAPNHRPGCAAKFDFQVDWQLLWSAKRIEQGPLPRNVVHLLDSIGQRPRWGHWWHAWIGPIASCSCVGFVCGCCSGAFLLFGSALRSSCSCLRGCSGCLAALSLAFGSLLGFLLGPPTGVLGVTSAPVAWRIAVPTGGSVAWSSAIPVAS